MNQRNSFFFFQGIRGTWLAKICDMDVISIDASTRSQSSLNSLDKKQVLYPSHEQFYQSTL